MRKTCCQHRASYVTKHHKFLYVASSEARVGKDTTVVSVVGLRSPEGIVHHIRHALCGVRFTLDASRLRTRPLALRRGDCGRLGRGAPRVNLASHTSNVITHPLTAWYLCRKNIFVPIRWLCVCVRACEESRFLPLF